jgi:hypothetical protein
MSQQGGCEPISVVWYAEKVPLLALHHRQHIEYVINCGQIDWKLWYTTRFEDERNVYGQRGESLVQLVSTLTVEGSRAGRGPPFWLPSMTSSGAKRPSTHDWRDDRCEPVYRIRIDSNTKAVRRSSSLESGSWLTWTIQCAFGSHLSGVFQTVGSATRRA